jgi:hypothetical protein
MPSVTSSDLNLLVSNLQSRARSKGDGLDALLPVLRTIARRNAPRDFPSRGLIDDVVSRALELLCLRGAGHFNPTRGSAKCYLRSIVRTAVRDVRDENQATIGRKRDYSVPAVGTAGWSVDEPTCELDSSIEVELELKRCLAHRPDLIIGAIAIAIDGCTVVDAASAGGLTRFKLVRQLSHLLEPANLAA